MMSEFPAEAQGSILTCSHAARRSRYLWFLPLASFNQSDHVIRSWSPPESCKYSNYFLKAVAFTVETFENGKVTRDHVGFVARDDSDLCRHLSELATLAPARKFIPTQSILAAFFDTSDVVRAINSPFPKIEHVWDAFVRVCSGLQRWHCCWPRTPIWPF